MFDLYSGKTLWSSTIWGKDQIMVVGRIIRFMFFYCSSKQETTGVACQWSEPFSALAYNFNQTTSNIVSNSYQLSN